MTAALGILLAVTFLSRVAVWCMQERRAGRHPFR
jgi:hypothetical protein